MKEILGISIFIHNFIWIHLKWRGIVSVGGLPHFNRKAAFVESKTSKLNFCFTQFCLAVGQWRGTSVISFTRNGGGEWKDQRLRGREAFQQKIFTMTQDKLKQMQQSLLVVTLLLLEYASPHPLPPQTKRNYYFYITLPVFWYSL